MTDAAKRALRTFVQAFIGTFALVAVPWMTSVVTAIVNAEPYELDFNILQSAGIAGVFAAAIALVSWIQNELEDKSAKNVLPK